MSKWAILTAVLLLAGIGLAYSSYSVSGAIGNSTCAKNGANSINETGNLSCVCPNKENCTGTCICLNNTTCSLNNCTYQNCTCIELGTENNSSNISCPINGPCPVTAMPSLKSSGRGMEGKIYTLTIPCSGCY
jgi:hypothetical protein